MKLRSSIEKDSDYEKDLITKRLILNEEVDFIALFGINKSGEIISSRLKSSIEEAGLKGFIFSALDYEVEVG